MSFACAQRAEHADVSVPLEVRDVTKRFRRRRLARARADHNRRERSFHTAVDSVSFRVEPEEIYGMIGANGSGKSTLIRMLSTLLVPDSGSVRVFGHDAIKEPLSVRRLLNRVSADPSFFRAMSPMENLLFYGRAYGLAGPVARHRSAELLERLGLERDRLKEPMLHMSRGQQQKVAVARAFLSTPRLLLLDEPTTGLDPRSKRAVQQFVKELQKDEGVSILLTTHDMDEAELLCDRIAFLAGGRMVAEGTPEQLRSDVAGEGRSAQDVDMEDVFMSITGRSLEEDEEADDGARGKHTRGERAPGEDER
jgi:ABC-2 type transport system ATP-binding protein